MDGFFLGGFFAAFLHTKQIPASVLEKMALDENFVIAENVFYVFGVVDYDSRWEGRDGDFICA